MADQLALALADRHAGQNANLAAGTVGHREHRDLVEYAVATLARSGTQFTADNVHALIRHELGADTPYDHNLVSSVMGVWAQQGRIREEPLRATASQQRSRRASRNRWWRGTAGPPSPRAPHQ